MLIFNKGIKYIYVYKSGNLRKMWTTRTQKARPGTVAASTASAGPHWPSSGARLGAQEQPLPFSEFLKEYDYAHLVRGLPMDHRGRLALGYQLCNPREGRIVVSLVIVPTSAPRKGLL